MRKFLERKFLVMLLGVLMNVLQNQLGIPPDTIAWLTALIMGWIGSEAVVDAVKTFKNPPVGPNPDDVAAGYADPEIPKKGFTVTAPPTGSHK